MALELSKSTTHDFAVALSALGFVDQDKATRRYAISPEIFRFVHLVSTEFGPNSALKPFRRVVPAGLLTSWPGGEQARSQGSLQSTAKTQ